MCGLYVYITCVCVSECTLIAHLYPKYVYTIQMFETHLDLGGATL